MKIATPAIGTMRLTSGIDSGTAIAVPVSQIVAKCLRRSAAASVRSTRRRATSWKYSRPSRKPLTIQKTRGASGATAR